MTDDPEYQDLEGTCIWCEDPNNFPGVDERGERQEEETQQRHHVIAVECSLKIGGEEPHQGESYSRKQQDDNQEQAGHGFMLAILCPRQKA